MENTYLVIKVNCKEDLQDVIIANLFELGFDSFQQYDEYLEGSCEKTTYSAEKLQELMELFGDISYEVREEEKVNWNEEWEKNYDPIIIEDKCIVRANFHQIDQKFDYEIVISPKMSFGTGHHATTYQMLAQQMELDHAGKKVIDVGCGTGVLAIMAKMRGAKSVQAIDIDDWCIENSQENFGLNNIDDIISEKKQMTEVKDRDFDIILANINKNVLMEQFQDYARKINAGGWVLLSGFYENDVEDLIAEGKRHALIHKKTTVKDNWAMMAFHLP